MSARAFPEFGEWFAAVHGHPPFAWQARLAAEVIADGWPAVIAAPTGTGKTAVIDVALFHLALEGCRPGRVAPVRIVYAVDRRVVVDQAYERACRIRAMLARAEGPCAAVAAALAGFGSAPLHIEQLRGGLPREDDWALSPAQPTILCTTIDQLGSRLLFRGYGVSPRMAPVHAGLLGEDALLLLDEAHLSRAFEETLAGIARHRGGGGRWGFTLLTATPRAEGARVFRLTEAERADPPIAVRLSTRKPASLVSVPCAMGSAAHVEAIAEQAWRLADGRAAPTVAAIVNRVQVARAVHAALEVFAAATYPETEDGVPPDRPRAILLTGRVRPVERDRLLALHAARLSAGGPRDSTLSPLFVVATQCIEAGADFDFDALVTQIAPLAALRQRFGRLDRLGHKRDAAAVMVATKDEVAAKADDAIYGDKAKRTWDWLAAVATEGVVDFGVDALDALAPPDDLADPGPSAPTLRRADVALFATTAPFPHPDPHLPLFLRGVIESETDVSIVWRADLPDELWRADPDEESLARAARILDILPPRPGEALSVPFPAARAWLASIRALVVVAPVAVAVADVASARPEPEGGEPIARTRATALRLPRARDAIPRLIIAHPAGREERLRPGDTIVVPCAYGGCDRYGWNPAGAASVDDLAEVAAAPYAARRAAMRLHPALVEAGWADPDLTPDGRERLGKAISRVAADASDARALARDAAGLDGLAPSLRAAFEALAGAESLKIEQADGKEGIGPVIAAPRGLRGEALTAFRAAFGLAPGPAAPVGEAATDRDDAGSFPGAELSLARHRDDVARTARAFANALGLSAELAATLELAGRLHDDGKADPRFQALLGATGAPLAKSASGVASRACRAAARVPEGWRHEALSVRLATRALDPPPEGVDADLALWLIGTHHGYGRPFFGAHRDGWDETFRPLADAAALEPGIGPERLDFESNGTDWPGLQARLTERYGAWGLAHLEAVLRLADHRASEAAA